jgi:hypothetical protein
LSSVEILSAIGILSSICVLRSAGIFRGLGFFGIRRYNLTFPVFTNFFKLIEVNVIEVFALLIIIKEVIVIGTMDGILVSQIKQKL